MRTTQRVLLVLMVMFAAVATDATAGGFLKFGDIKGEFTPNLHSGSWNVIGDIKGEFVPNLDITNYLPVNRDSSFIFL